MLSKRLVTASGGANETYDTGRVGMSDAGYATDAPTHEPRAKRYGDPDGRG
jgi:hypothetical protein